MSTVEAHLRLRLDSLLNDARGFFHGLRGRVVGQAKLEHNAAFLQAFVVLDRAADHAGVGHDDLLATQAADACGFQAHMFNGARQRANDDEVAYLEGFVHGD